MSTDSTHYVISAELHRKLRENEQLQNSAPSLCDALDQAVPVERINDARVPGRFTLSELWVER